MSAVHVPGLSMKDYGKGSALFAFQLVPDAGACGVTTATGNCALDLTFKEKLSESINVIVFQDADATVSHLIAAVTLYFPSSLFSWLRPITFF